MPLQGEKWFDNALRLWSVRKVDDRLIECVGPRDVIEFFDAQTLVTTSKFEPGLRLFQKFVDEHAPKPRKKPDDQST